jgi:protein arginine N-methyltransferase 1
MSESQLVEHQGYLADEPRTAAYRAALAEVVEPGDVVLDLGSGTGVLGYLSSDAGASSVVAIDGSEMSEIAQRIARDNGYADRITHLRAMSTEIALDPLADVIVCDQIGGLVHDAGILGFYADARKRLLAPGGRLVPSSFRIFLAPVTYDECRRRVDFWASAPASVDVSSVQPLAANTEWHVIVKTEDVTKLAPGAELASFGSDHDDSISGSAEFTVETPGRLDGFLGWFEAQLSPSVTLTNDPWSSERFDRWCNFYPLEETVDVAAGDRVVVSLDIRPRHAIVSWNTEITDGAAATRRMRQSTFLATPGADLFGQGGAVAATERIDLARIVLDHIDGMRTQEAIVAALDHMVGSPTGFASRLQLESFVRRVARLVE